MISALENAPRFGFSTLGCPDAAFEEVVALAASFGLDFIELRCLEGHVLDPETLATLFPEPVAARQILSEAGVGIHVLGTSVNIFEGDPSSRNILAGFARAAGFLRSPWLRVFDGGKAGFPPSDDEWSAAAKTIASWNECNAKLGFQPRLLVETHWALTDPAVAAEFCRRFPDVGLLWDTHHTWKAGFQLKAFWEENAGCIFHMHVKDSCGDNSAKSGFRYTLPGEGEFPWDDLHRIIKSSRYTGSISLEWEKHWHPELAPLSNALSAWSRVRLGLGASR